MADTEKHLRQYVRQILEDDFVVHEGVHGREVRSAARVHYDLVLAPRPHLIEQGFDEGCVIVEVKRFDVDDRNSNDTKIRDLLWQCVTYSYSLIELPGHGPRWPLFVLSYVGGTGLQDRYLGEMRMLYALVQRGGIGRLELTDSPAAQSRWSMWFVGSLYFRQHRGRGPHNVGTKRQVGSSR